MSPVSIIESLLVLYLQTATILSLSSSFLIPYFHSLHSTFVLSVNFVPSKSIAAGMSIRYFPIFFLSNLRLNPVIVQILFFSSVVCQIPLSIVAQRGAKRIGRCQMTVLFKWIGVLCFVSMILSYRYRLSNVLISILWIGRTSLMNSCSALTKSIIMDAVPQCERGKWSALESVNMFSWSGSAFLGGILVGEEGIIFNFTLTCCMQAIAILPLLYISRMVPAEGDSHLL